MKIVTENWRRFRATRGVLRELLTILLCLIVGVLLMPAAVYFTGSRVFGSYSGGSYWHFVRDLAAGLGSGLVPFWLFAIGPYGAVWLWRIWRWSLRTG